MSSNVNSFVPLNLYDKVDDQTFSLDGDSMEQYPEIGRLKMEIWKKVYHWLTPVSKACPPNNVRSSLHARAFNTKTVSNKEIEIGTKTSDQIIGSSVIVVSFFDEQLVQMRMRTRNSEHELPTHDYFTAEHCSVYILDPQDEKVHQHNTSFPASRQQKPRTRLALTFRWMRNPNAHKTTMSTIETNLVSI